MEWFRKANACSRITFLEYLEAKKLVRKMPNLVDTYIGINTGEIHQGIDLSWMIIWIYGRYMATEELINKGLAERFIGARNILFHDNRKSMRLEYSQLRITWIDLANHIKQKSLAATLEATYFFKIWHLINEITTLMKFLL